MTIIGFLGMWLDEYGDNSSVVKRMRNIYYHAVPASSISGSVDPAEVVELGWFAEAELPEKLAFPGHVPVALQAWRRA